MKKITTALTGLALVAGLSAAAVAPAQAAQLAPVSAPASASVAPGVGATVGATIGYDSSWLRDYINQTVTRANETARAATAAAIAAAQKKAGSANVIVGNGQGASFYSSGVGTMTGIPNGARGTIVGTATINGVAVNSGTYEIVNGKPVRVK